ncbi:MAG: DUF512 domain-containing protein [Desulfuromonas sp.]|nr:MAG: DUF512 domain-containing protein [Desulfuromonas sp.]
MLEIISVEEGSIAEQLDLCAGDCLIAVNGEPVYDQIDYQLLVQGEALLLDVEKSDGELWELEFERDAEEALGVAFAEPAPRQCHNRCQFCFVRQLPDGLRKSLYVRDDDYRYSYLYGAYISLTNLTQDDIERIIRQKLSPLYVSVHATDPSVRSTLLGRPVESPLPLLKRLLTAGITLHTQIVLCPDVNDGAVLDQTIADLVPLYPGIRTLAVVPVGLTGHRRALPLLHRLRPEQCAQVIGQIAQVQQQCLHDFGSRFVFAADEFYLQAGQPIPSGDFYEDFAQIENGVGLVALFRQDAGEVLSQAGTYPGFRAGIVTGESAARELQEFVGEFNRLTESALEIYVIRNHFFGGGVTVAGLLTGTDIVQQLKGQSLPPVLLIPDVVCREGEDILLDDMTLETLAITLDVEVAKIDPSPWGVMDFIECYFDLPV